MYEKTPIYCPKSKNHENLGEILFAIGSHELYLYCYNRKCQNERGGTWLKVEFIKRGNPMNFKNAKIKLTDMPRGYHLTFNRKKEMIYDERD